jgi:hypothetical protein
MNESDIEYIDLLLDGAGTRITELLQDKSISEELETTLFHSKSHIVEARRDLRAAEKAIK